MGKNVCVACGRERVCTWERNSIGEAVCVCAKCRVRYFPTREERAQAERVAERAAERDAELYAENGLCGFEF